MNTIKPFSETLALWPEERRNSIAQLASADRVRSILGKERLSLEDFLTLLTPSATPFLEQMARRAQAESQKHFGKAIHLFSPLYLSDHCTNQCRYCGFNAKNKQKRLHLSVEDAKKEALALAKSGIGHILLLTGDARKISSPEYIASVAKNIKPYFASVGIEVYAMTSQEYAMLVENGVDSMTMFQETYNPVLYSYLHPAGPKRDYAYRLEAPTRAVEGGMYSINVGALLGLETLENDGFCTGLHAYWLQKQSQGVEVGLSVPRICPHEGNFDVPHALDNHRFVQYITAVRCFMPRVGITVSSRENAFMRDNLINLGVTKVSASVSTAVGGRSMEGNDTGQFEISDNRSVQEMTKALASKGFQAVTKDWQDAFNY